MNTKGQLWTEPDRGEGKHEEVTDEQMGWEERRWLTASVAAVQPVIQQTFAEFPLCVGSYSESWNTAVSKTLWSLGSSELNSPSNGGKCLEKNKTSWAW